MKKFIKILSNCFIVLLTVILIVLITISFVSGKDGLMKISKYSLFYVEGNSMYPEIKEGDFIAVIKRLAAILPTSTSST